MGIASKELNDYANRQWAELNHTYYAPRWSMFIDRVIDAAKQDKKFDADEYFTTVRNFENNWIEPSPLEVETMPASDDIETARLLYSKYANKIIAHPASGGATDCVSLHHW